MAQKRIPKTGDEFIRLAKRGDCIVRNGHGSHVMVYFGKDKGTQCVPRGNKQLGPGLHSSLVKAFVAAGLLAMMFGWINLIG